MQNVLGLCAYIIQLHAAGEWRLAQNFNTSSRPSTCQVPCVGWIQRDDPAFIRQETELRLARQAQCVVEEHVVAAAAPEGVRVPLSALVAFHPLCFYALNQRLQQVLHRQPRFPPMRIREYQTRNSRGESLGQTQTKNVDLFSAERNT